MNILSIDVAVSKDVAYAGFSNGILEYFGKVKKLTELENVISAYEHNVDMMVTEDMYLYKNIDTLKKLCYVVGGMIFFCEMYNIKYRLINPATWQSYHGLLKTPASLRRKIEDEILKTVTNKIIEDDDIRSAILMGLCHIEQMRLK